MREEHVATRVHVLTADVNAGVEALSCILALMSRGQRAGRVGREGKMRRRCTEGAHDSVCKTFTRLCVDQDEHSDDRVCVVWQVVATHYSVAMCNDTRRFEQQRASRAGAEGRAVGKQETWSVGQHHPLCEREEWVRGCPPQTTK
jgi:hypothetical protein